MSYPPRRGTQPLPRTNWSGELRSCTTPWFPAIKFPDFIGAYELAPGQTRKIIVEGDSLFVERSGNKDQLFPEASELFFRKGVEGRILFRYDKKGKVDALIDRRNNEDVVWRKVT